MANDTTNVTPIVTGEVRFDDGRFELSTEFSQHLLRQRGNGKSLSATFKVPAESFNIPVVDGSGNILELPANGFVTVTVPFLSVEAALTEGLESEVIARRNIDRKKPLLTPTQRRNNRIARARLRAAEAKTADYFADLNFSSLGEMLRAEIVDPTITNLAKVKAREIGAGLESGKMSKAMKVQTKASLEVIAALLDGCSDVEEAITKMMQMAERLAETETSTETTPTVIPAEVAGSDEV